MFYAFVGYGVEVAFAEDQVGVALDFYLVLVVGAEEDSVAYADRADMGAYAADLAPGEALGDLGVGRDEDAAAAAPFTGFLGHAHHDPVVQHLDL